LYKCRYYSNVIENVKGKRPFRRPRHRWEDNIRVDLREIAWNDANWIHLTQDRDQRWALVNTVMNFGVP
jgi:hypothetical protein